MPRKFMFTKEEIVASAFEIVREGGFSALTARSLAEKLGCSAKPIFGLFKSMDELSSEVKKMAEAYYEVSWKNAFDTASGPPYKARGMAYIRFAAEEKELFKILFMRDRSGETVADSREEIRPILEYLKKSLGISEDEACRFHLEMWIFTHGIAAMVNTGYLPLDNEFVSRSLTDVFSALAAKYKGELQ